MFKHRKNDLMMDGREIVLLTTDDCVMHMIIAHQKKEFRTTDDYILLVSVAHEIVLLASEDRKKCNLATVIDFKINRKSISPANHIQVAEDIVSNNK